MYNILAILFKYIFIIIIYLFIFSIIRLIYLDIRGMNGISKDEKAYLKLINKKHSLPFKIEEYYSINKSISLGRRGDNDIIIKDPYISTLLMIVDDSGINAGKKRDSVLSPFYKNIAISCVMVNKTFCAYFTFAK